MQTNTDKTDGIKIFCGTVNEQLAKDIAKELDLSICKMKVSRFSDGEVGVEIQDNVRGKDVYIIQSICPPINESLMELLLVISTMKRSSANTITAIIPYFGYARQNSIHYRVRSIAASEVARMLESMGVDRVVAVDLHRGQIQVKT